MKSSRARSKPVRVQRRAPGRESTSGCDVSRRAVLRERCRKPRPPGPRGTRHRRGDAVYEDASAGGDVEPRPPRRGWTSAADGCPPMPPAARCDASTPRRPAGCGRSCGCTRTRRASARSRRPRAPSLPAPRGSAEDRCGDDRPRSGPGATIPACSSTRRWWAIRFDGIDSSFCSSDGDASASSSSSTIASRPGSASAAWIAARPTVPLLHSALIDSILFEFLADKQALESGKRRASTRNYTVDQRVFVSNIERAPRRVARGSVRRSSFIQIDNPLCSCRRSSMSTRMHRHRA